MARSPIAPVGRRVAGTEMGVLLGFMAQRVLGQYDLLVPDDPDAPERTDAVYYVGPNILALEKRYAFRPRDFRLWIAIHEVTHRAQFTAVPWMKPYFLSLVERSAWRSSTPIPDGSCRRWSALPTSYARVATRSTTAVWSRCSRRPSSAACSPRCRR